MKKKTQQNKMPAICAYTPNIRMKYVVHFYNIDHMQGTGSKANKKKLRMNINTEKEQQMREWKLI